MDLGTTLSLLLTLLTGIALGALLAVLVLRGRVDGHEVAASRRAVQTQVEERAVVRAGLERLEGQMRDLEHHRVSWQSQLRQQVDEVRHSTDTLRRETAALSTALRRPQVRGRWGELHLRRAVELAGLVDRVDFEEQVSVAGETGSLRPDLVVHLAGDKHVVVDAKVPLDAFLDATGADDDEQQVVHLRRHARQVRQHVDALAGKTYWRAVEGTPEFVVLFVPGESFLSSALEVEPGLLDYAAQRHVVLATPTTLIALLRTVAHAWTQESLADKAREIHALGRELHTRLATMGSHLERLGRSLGAAVGAYNRTVGSLETRVLVSARKLSDLDVGYEEIDPPAQVQDSPRLPGAPELTSRSAGSTQPTAPPATDELDLAAPARPELPDLEPGDRTGARDGGETGAGGGEESRSA